MCLRFFLNTYFHDWKIASISTYQNHGNMRLRMNETFILVYFNMNDATSWADSRVTVDRVEACE